MDDLRSARDHYGLAHPLNGVEKRLDALIAELRGLRLVLAPAEPEPDPESVDGYKIELREPETTGTRATETPKRPAPPKAKRR